MLERLELGVKGPKSRGEAGFLPFTSRPWSTPPTVGPAVAAGRQFQPEFTTASRRTGDAPPSTWTTDRRTAMTHRSRARMRTFASVTTALTFATFLTASTAAPAVPAARENAVVAWDQRAEYAIWDIAAQPPYVNRRSFAMVHGAVYDAVNAIDGTRYQPLIAAPRATGRESRDAAVGAAAYRVLDSLFPAQHDRLLSEYTSFLAAIPDGRSKQGGVEVGNRAAAAMTVRSVLRPGRSGRSRANGGPLHPFFSPTRPGWGTSVRS